MNHFYFLVQLLLTLLVAPLFAQNTLLQISSPRSQGLGNISLNLSDIHSLWGNQAGLAALDQWSVMAMTEQRFLLADVNLSALGAALPTFSGVWGISVSQFGLDGYRESKVGLAYARLLSDRLRIGGQLHWSQLNLATYGARSGLNFDVGLQAELLPGLWTAVQIRNAIRQTLIESEYQPTLLSLGLLYPVSEKVALFTELTKDIDFPADVRFGLEYNPVKALILRLGGSTTPGTWSFGFALPILKNFTFDAAAVHHPYLGFTPSAGLVYTPSK